MVPEEIPISQSDLVAKTTGLSDTQKAGATVVPTVGTASNAAHINSDVDGSHLAMHHTIGISANQVNSGIHDHDGINSRQITDVVDLLIRVSDLEAQVNALMNANLLNIRAAFNPSWVGSTTNPTLGNGTCSMDWVQLGNQVFFALRIVFGSTTNVGSGFYSWSLPVSPAGVGNLNTVSGVVYNNAHRFPLTGVIENDRLDRLIVADAKTGGTPLLGNAGWFSAWTTGDYIYVEGWYWDT